MNESEQNEAKSQFKAQKGFPFVSDGGFKKAQRHPAK
jgi:hypothetical protein